MNHTSASTMHPKRGDYACARAGELVSTRSDKIAARPMR